MKTWKKIAIGCLTALLCVSIVSLTMGSTAASNTTVVETIYDTLKALGEKNDLQLDNIPLEDGEREGFYCNSNDTNREYWFDQNGNLIKLITTLADDVVESQKHVPPVDETKLNENAICLAKACMNNYLIGQLEIESRESFNGIYDYVLVEYFDGKQTGSRIGFECLSDGTVIFAIPIRGQIFKKDTTGTLQPQYEVNVDVDQAVITARREVESRISGTDFAVADQIPVVKMEALKDRQFYKVEMSTVSETEGYEIIYYVCVDTASGEIIKVDMTQ